MSGVRAPHLQRRDGVYYLRLRVPDALRPLVGQTEIVKSLRTASLRIARPRSALLTALVMEAFEVIKTTEMTANDAKRLIRGCFVQVIAEQEEQPSFVPDTEDWDQEYGEQRFYAESRIEALKTQIDSKKIVDAEVCRRVRDLMTRNGFSQHDISKPRSDELADGMARILVEQQRLFLARLEDRFAEYMPVEPLFAAATPSASNTIAGGNGQAFHGPNLGEAVETYLNASKKVWRYRTHLARVWQLGYLVQFLGAERPMASIKPDDIRRYRDAVISLRANHGKAKVQAFAEKQTDNLKARIKPKTADYIFQPVKAFFA